MKITYISLKGFKRFRLGTYTQMEAYFKSPVVVIVGSNGSGKSSFMRELCPLPSVRTDFEPGGKKEIHIEDMGNHYILISDFSNRSAPHSFKMNGKELNVSGTTEVQTSLVEKHFGITNHIRKLIYSQVKVCQATKADRKNLFHNINPMDLSIILDTHKKASSRVRDLKATLNHLYSRKGELENKLLTPDVFTEHMATKERLSELDQLLGKILYGLEQHIHMLRDRYKDDLRYKEECSNQNKPLVPSEEIIRSCRHLYHTMGRFSHLCTGEHFHETKNSLYMEKQTIDTQRMDLRKHASQIAAEIDEFQKHLDTATDRPVDNLEKEIKDIDTALKGFPSFPSNTIATEYVRQCEQAIEQIRSILLVFRDCEAKMIEPKELEEKFQKFHQMNTTVTYRKGELNRLSQRIQSAKAEIEHNKKDANIPSDCVSSKCGLFQVFSQRSVGVENQLAEDTKRFTVLEEELSVMEKELSELSVYLAPFGDHDLLSQYNRLERLLDNGLFTCRDWKTELLGWIQTQPMYILSLLDEFIKVSKQKHEYDLMLKRRDELQSEMDTIAKAASLDFLKHKLKEKEVQSADTLAKLEQLDSRAFDVNREYQLYEEYALALAKTQEFGTQYDRGERALLVSKSIEYWNGLGKYYSQIKSHISEELRHLESIVRNQENLRSTYNTEILGVVEQLAKDKFTYEKIEAALSPTSGLPHKSMVDYLNVLVTNVNNFLSQIWTYKLKIFPIRKDMPLDYNFRIEVGSSTSNDISQLSDGQFEVVNLAWVLTILLQLRILDKIPLFADELGRTFDPVHRMQILKFLGHLIDNKIIGQMFIANHFAMFTDGFNDCDVICLDQENMLELPKLVNEHVRFV